MSALEVRTMEQGDWGEVAELIYLSTNAWYRANRGMNVFSCPPEACRVFCETYETLDPDCCIVVTNINTGRIVGSCFYHPRSTHISIGIVNTHPNYFGRGVAKRMMDYVIRLSEREGKPLRLVSSAMNLDSYSLYTRLGFVPRMAFQDMYLAVPPGGLDIPPLLDSSRIRPGVPSDAVTMAELERELIGIEREKDYRYFLENRDDLWSVSVLEGAHGSLDGFLASVGHPASNMVGPGVARTEDGIAALLRAQLDNRRGLTPVFLLPVECPSLVQRLYSWGARNCELHFAQIRGEWQKPTGILLPTFLPETG